MFDNEITTGTSPLTFSPDDTVTRGQLAAFFYRFKDSPDVVFDAESRTCDPFFEGERFNLFISREDSGAADNPDCTNLGALPPPVNDLATSAWGCSADRNHPAGVPFFLHHGIDFIGEPADALAAGTRVDVFVDGVKQVAEEVHHDPAGPFAQGMVWRYAFRDGMLGSHTFVVEWYTLGILVLRSEVEATFT